MAIALALALLLPLIPVFRPEGQRFQLALILIYAVIGLSLTVAIGWAGQVRRAGSQPSQSCSLLE